MTAPKYQIFVSSTYADLKDEREQIIKAVLEMGHIPVGMEMFSAADEEQWKIIARHIDQSDYYAVLVAHRYGSVVPKEGISFTEKEYDYAISAGVPVIGFVIENGASWPADRVDTDRVAKKKLDTFKKKVMSKPVNFWANADDLHGKFAISLMKLFTTNPRPGWVRATGPSGQEVAAELSRLSRENAELRKELESSKNPISEITKLLFDKITCQATAQVQIGTYGANTPMMSQGRPLVDFYWYEVIEALMSGHETKAKATFNKELHDLFASKWSSEHNDATITNVIIDPESIQQIFRRLIIEEIVPPFPLSSIDGSPLRVSKIGYTYLAALEKIKTNGHQMPEFDHASTGAM